MKKYISIIIISIILLIIPLSVNAQSNIDKIYDITVSSQSETIRNESRASTNLLNQFINNITNNPFTVDESGYYYFATYVTRNSDCNITDNTISSIRLNLYENDNICSSYEYNSETNNFSLKSNSLLFKIPYYSKNMNISNKFSSGYENGNETFYSNYPNKSACYYLESGIEYKFNTINNNMNVYYDDNGNSSYTIKIYAQKVGTTFIEDEIPIYEYGYPLDPNVTFYINGQSITGNETINDISYLSYVQFDLYTGIHTNRTNEYCGYDFHILRYHDNTDTWETVPVNVNNRPIILSPPNGVFLENHTYRYSFLFDEVVNLETNVMYKMAVRHYCTINPELNGEELATIIFNVNNPTININPHDITELNPIGDYDNPDNVPPADTNNHNIPNINIPDYDSNYINDDSISLNFDWLIDLINSILNSLSKLIGKMTERINILNIDNNGYAGYMAMFLGGLPTSLTNIYVISMIIFIIVAIIKIFG